VAGERPKPFRDTTIPRVTKGRLRQPFHRTRTVAWAASEARLRKEGIGWTPTVVGIDVSKSQLDVHVRGSDESFVVARDAEGLAALSERLRPLAPSAIGL